MWNTADGTLLWDALISAPVDTSTASVSTALLGEDVATLADGERVELRSGATGKLSWSWTAAESGVSIQQLFVPEEGDAIFGVGRHSVSSALTVIKLSSRKGKLSSSQQIEGSEGTLAADQSVHIFGEHAAYVDTSTCSVVVHKLSTDSVQVTPLSGLESAQGSCSAVSIRATTLPTQLLVQMSSSTTLLVELDKATLELRPLHTFSGRFAFSTASTGDRSQMLAGVSVGKEEAQVSLFTLDPFEQWMSTGCSQLTAATNGAVLDIFLSSFTKTNGMVGARVLVVTRDHRLSLVINGEVRWYREESLARIQQVEFVVPPVADASMDDQAAAPGNLLDGLLGKIQGKPPLAVAPPEAAQTPSDGTQHVYADRFGFRRIAVLMTDAGKVVAMNTETAEIVWSHFYDKADGDISASILRQMVLLRNSREYPPECLVIGHDPASSHFPTFLSSFNPLTGDEGHFQALRYDVRHAILLPDKVSEQRRLLLIIDGDYKAHVYPDTEEAQMLLAQRSSNIFFYEVDKNTNSFRGFRLVAGKDDAYRCEQTWQVVLPKEERIDSIQQRSTEDSIFSPFHVTGSHSVLFKYLNPNLLLVSTVSEHMPFYKNRGTQADAGSSVHLYAIDSVTGHVTYHVAHPHSSGPTQLILSENWVVHSYWSTRHLRTELSVLELWEDTGVDDSTLTLITKNIKKSLFSPIDKDKHIRSGAHFSTDVSAPRNQLFSAFDKQAPLKEEQSFVLSTNIKSLGVTSTQLGITSKHLLVGSTADQLHAIPWQLITPRRPIAAPNEAEMAEGLMQYNAQLPVMSTNILSYNHTISNLRAIRAVPADLESTSLVLAYGIDLFFIRVTPSKAFDVLDDQFNYAGLMLTVVILVVAAAICCYIVKKKDLEFAWK
jgi:outer membrane protein assembly factor BamB